MAKVIGIDLGTTKLMHGPSWKAANPPSWENSEGRRITPSVVAFTKSGERFGWRPCQTPGHHQFRATPPFIFH